jgi:hypothetical protein
LIYLVNRLFHKKLLSMTYQFIHLLSACQAMARKQGVFFMIPI